MGIDSFVRSKTYKQITAKMYGWGASIVIIGALFKIQHWPGATPMLIIGMGIESLIFFASAFEPLHVEYDWSLAYPELAGMEDLTEEEKQQRREAVAAERKNSSGGITVEGGGNVVLGGGSGSGSTQQLDKMLEDAKIGPELIES